MISRDFCFPLHTVHPNTIMPRLEYSQKLLRSILSKLKKEQSLIKKQNTALLNLPEYRINDIQHVDYQRKIDVAVESLSRIDKTLGLATGMYSIPHILPSIIPIIRIISASLYPILPTSSTDLGNLSTMLGSIITDSAIITGAKLDFESFNHESTLLLDKVKLIVESKINKLHPNLETLKADIV